MGDALALIVQNIATVTAGLIIAFTANWMLALVVLAVSPFIVMQGYVQTKFLTGFSADAKVVVVTLLCCFSSGLVIWFTNLVYPGLDYV